MSVSAVNERRTRRVDTIAVEEDGARALPAERQRDPPRRFAPWQARAHGYDAQALRFETHWGSADIIRGANGPVIGTVGWFGDFDVERLVASSPQAVT